MIPRIDISALLEEGFEAPRSHSVLEQIRTAGADLGFMTVCGHGVPPDLMIEMDAAARAFFALGIETKTSVSPRPWNRETTNVYRGYFPSSTAGKEGFDIGEPALATGDPQMDALLDGPYSEVNRFPTVLGRGWRATVERYFDALSSLGGVLVGAMVAALGGDPNRIAEAFHRPRSLSTLRLNFYPPRGQHEAPIEVSREDGVALACETYVDSGLLTILYQDAQAGLQVRDRKRVWHDVPFDPDVFVVNTGLAFERITDRAFIATRHRVLLSPAERLSIPFFFEPVREFVLAPGSLGLTGDLEDDAEPYGRFLRELLTKFAEYDR
ncbi:MAG: isopenicillin N synthase family oxygenase [bacterium]|nr:isopenicillin N synthase family oxygenase [bacterium]